jgi:hypothetical protein
MYSKTMTHHQSRGNANHLVRLHAKQAAWSAHIPSVFRANHASINAALNANGMI